jgi:hypothetical protein
MELYLLEKDGQPRGYFLLTHPPGQVRLADCWLDADDPFDWCSLLHCAVREAHRRPDAAELVVWGSDPLLASCLEECGFHPRSSRPVQILASKSCNLPANASLRVQMLDCDAAFLHTGSPVLWA